MKSALIVVDVQNIYTAKNSDLYCEASDKTVAKINRLIDRFEHESWPIIFVRHVHKPDGSDIGRMFDYTGDPAKDFNSGRRRVADYKILPKRSLSSMSQNIWLVIIVVFIILVLLGVITVATK